MFLVLGDVLLLYTNSISLRRLQDFNVHLSNLTENLRSEIKSPSERRLRTRMVFWHLPSESPSPTFGTRLPLSSWKSLVSWHLRTFNLTIRTAEETWKTKTAPICPREKATVSQESQLSFLQRTKAHFSLPTVFSWKERSNWTFSSKRWILRRVRDCLREIKDIKRRKRRKKSRTFFFKSCASSAFHPLRRDVLTISSHGIDSWTWWTFRKRSCLQRSSPIPLVPDWPIRC